VGKGALQVAPLTSDGDLALQPVRMEDEPFLAEAFVNARSRWPRRGLPP